jgi:hypothetical protein
MTKLKFIKTIMFFGFLIFSIYIFFSIQRGRLDYVNREYYGIISEIRTLPLSHDIPDIKINNEWLSFTIDDSKVKNYIMVGDSIVKKTGQKEILIYRKNADSEWEVKKFK